MLNYLNNNNKDKTHLLETFAQKEFKINNCYETCTQVLKQNQESLEMWLKYSIAYIHTHTQVHLAWQDKTILIFIAPALKESVMYQGHLTHLSLRHSSVLLASLFYCFLIYGSQWAKALTWGGHTLHHYYYQVDPSYNIVSKIHQKGKVSYLKIWPPELIFKMFINLKKT